jgi:hypothetical protein
MALLEQDVFLVIEDAAGLGSASSAAGGGGGCGIAPFLCVAPLFYPQPGCNAGMVLGEFFYYLG